MGSLRRPRKMPVHYGAIEPIQDHCGATKRKVSLVGVGAASALVALVLVAFVLIAGVSSGAETEKLLDARDEIKQLSNMIKNKVHSDQSFDKYKTTPHGGSTKPKPKKAVLAQSPSSGAVKKSASSPARSSGTGGKAAAKKLVAKMQKDGLKVPNDLLKMAGEDHKLVAPSQPGPGVVAQPKLAASAAANSQPMAMPVPGSGLPLKVRQTVAKLKGALSSLEQVENIMG